jgi:hypothetical protein
LRVSALIDKNLTDNKWKDSTTSPHSFTGVNEIRTAAKHQKARPYPHYFLQDFLARRKRTPWGSLPGHQQEIKGNMKKVCQPKAGGKNLR